MARKTEDTGEIKARLEGINRRKVSLYMYTGLRTKERGQKIR